MPRSLKPKLSAGESSPENKTKRPASRRSRATSMETAPVPKAAGASEKPPARKRKAAALPQVADASTALLQERYQRIQAEAYFIAERRGFHGGSPEDDWFQAERRIDEMSA
jgi:hypothetical protein